jgi:diguanylate cyclase (GGDEF)-like protein
VVAKPVRALELIARVRAALRGRVERDRRTTRVRKLSDTIENLKAQNFDLQRLACVDSLTGIANRRHTLQLLEAEWRRSLRERAPLAVVMVDLDNFHAYNEHYGHRGGDACLQRVAGVMSICLRRPGDFLGRYGGEELIAVLPGTDATGAMLVAERLRAAVAALAIPHVGSSPGVVTITAGYAAFAEPDGDGAALIERADRALLRAKTSGKNQIAGDATPPVRRTRVDARRWQRFPPVCVDPWFASRIPAFLAEARTIGELARAGEVERTRSAARQLRNTAAVYGFGEIDRIAGAVLAAARETDRRGLAAAGRELLDYATYVQVVYRRGLESEIQLTRPNAG